MLRRMKRRLTGLYATFGVVVSTGVLSKAGTRSRYRHVGRQLSACSNTPSVAFATRSSTCTKSNAPRGGHDNNEQEEEKAAKSKTGLPNFVISGATRYQDYSDVGSLLVNVFDDASSSSSSYGKSNSKSNNNNGVSSSLIDNILWDTGVTKAFAARRYTNRYISTVRKMRGKKYSLVLAKSYGGDVNKKINDDKENINTGTDTDGRSSHEEVDSAATIKPGTVVGVAEVGLSTYPLVVGTDTNTKDYGSSPTTEVLASVGVLAVDPSQRQSGIGSALLAAAESVARRWGETYLYVAVEPGNEVALRFFEGSGYASVKTNADTNTDAVTVYVEVAERMKMERRPHILLAKEILSTNESDASIQNDDHASSVL